MRVAAVVFSKQTIEISKMNYSKIVIPTLLLMMSLSSFAANPDPRADWFANPFSAESAHHRPIGTGAVYADDDHPAMKDFRRHFSAIGINPGYRPWGCGIWESTADDPEFSVNHFALVDRGNPERFPVTLRLPLDMVMLQRRNASGNFDGVLVVFDRVTETAHQFRQFNWNDETPTPDSRPTAGSYVTWDIQGKGHGNFLMDRVGTSASGVAGAFGILRGWELKKPGHAIGHALQMAIPRKNEGEMMLGREVWWPAVSTDGDARTNETHNTGNVPYGSLWALPPEEKGGPDLTTLGLSEMGMRLAECIRDYGIYVVDGGGQPAIRADQDVSTELARALKSETAKIYPYIRMILNSVPDEGKVVFQVGDNPYNPTGGTNRQIIPGEFPAGGGEPLAPSMAIDAR